MSICVSNNLCAKYSQWCDSLQSSKHQSEDLTHSIFPSFPVGVKGHLEVCVGLNFTCILWNLHYLKSLVMKSGINVKHNSSSPTCWVAVTVQACNFTADSKQDWEFRVKISSEILSYKVMKVDQESKSKGSPNKLKAAVWLSLSLI